MRFNNTPLDFDAILTKLQKAAELLLPYKEEVVALLLFGSAHRQTTTPLSDIDLAVLYRSGLDQEQMLKLHLRLYSDLSQLMETDDFDLVNLNLAPLTLQFSVIEDKTVLALYNPEELVDFQAKVMTLYQDFHPILEEYYRNRLKLAGGTQNG
jgi:predicted nucleotidyltransferase